MLLAACYSTWGISYFKTCFLPNLPSLSMKNQSLVTVSQSEFTTILRAYYSFTGRLTISSKDSIEVIPFRNLSYCKGQGAYTHLYLNDGRKIVASNNISYYNEKLPQAAFLRTHQSYIVNLHSIVRYYRQGYLLLRDDVEIPVAHRRRDWVIQTLRNIFDVAELGASD